MPHTIAMWAIEKFSRDQLQVIIAQNLDHSIKTNMNIYQHKHRRHSDCIKEMMPDLPGRMDEAERPDAHDEHVDEMLGEMEQEGRGPCGGHHYR